MEYWKQRVDAGVQITVPDEKANALFRTCLVNDLLALNYDGQNWIQTVNQLHYHNFYLRDSADFVRMYDATGYPQIAAQVRPVHELHSRRRGLQSGIYKTLSGISDHRKDVRGAIKCSHRVSLFTGDKWQQRKPTIFRQLIRVKQD
ncbi:hypothetical protein JAO29_17050 [Edaphobacter sp. HDX4]|uniref:hypothetical protein n=1 Tax=Edaphobacter sp. HDX4 TaxID=2794064 RepID=UPI002FE6927E